MKATQENVLIGRDLLSNLIQETSYLIAQSRIWGKTEPECRMVCGLLAQVTVAMNGKPFAEHGLECPVCHHVVDDADYWDGDRCLKCRLEGVGRADLASILSKPEGDRKGLDYVEHGQRKRFRMYNSPPRAPDAFAEPDEDRTCLPDSEMP